MKNIIFKYELKDAFDRPIKSLIVDKDNKLHLISNKEDSVSEIKTDKINKMLQKYEEEFKNVKTEEIPFVPVMDGYLNEVSFSVNDKVYNDEIKNLCYYDSETIDNSKHLTVILNLLDDVYDELYSQNKKIKKYFVLDDEED